MLTARISCWFKICSKNHMRTWRNYIYISHVFSILIPASSKTGLLKYSERDPQRCFSGLLRRRFHAQIQSSPVTHKTGREWSWKKQRFSTLFDGPKMKPRVHQSIWDWKGTMIESQIWQIWSWKYIMWGAFLKKDTMTQCTKHFPKKSSVDQKKCFEFFWMTNF